MTLLGRCNWCGGQPSKITKDHVFPKALGGTLDADLWVSSCSKCQTCISQAEREVAQRSQLALYRYARGLKPRHKKRPYSGLVDAKLLLVKNPGTRRYAVVSLRCGEPCPRTLPAIEINIETGDLYYHGECPEDVHTLLRTLRDRLAEHPRPDGEVLEVSYELLEEYASDASADPDFNPRLYLSPRGEFHGCARNEEELEKAVKAILFLAGKGGLPDPDPRRWETSNIPAGTPHKVALIYDTRMLQRVLLKMGYGTVCAWLRRKGKSPLFVRRITDAVRGESDPSEFKMENLWADEQPSRKWEEHLLVAVSDASGTVCTLVSLYGFWYVFDLGSAEQIPSLPPFMGACCHVTKRSQAWLTESQAEDVFRLYRDGDLHVFEASVNPP